MLREAAARLGVEIVSLESDIAIVRFNGKEHVIGFGNIRPRIAMTAQNQRRAYMDHFLKATFEAKEQEQSLPLDEVRQLMMPRVGTPFAPLEKRPVSAPLVPGHLEVNLVVDAPNSVM